MKNRRDVCLAKDAGFIQYPGLPGHIKTGCMATPAFKSRYCPQHTTRAYSSVKETPAEENLQGPAATYPSLTTPTDEVTVTTSMPLSTPIKEGLNNLATKCLPQITPTEEGSHNPPATPQPPVTPTDNSPPVVSPALPTPQGAVIEMLLEKKTTRQTTYYKVHVATHHYTYTCNNTLPIPYVLQVLWLGKPEKAISWEPESSLPAAVVQEFESGISAEVTQHVAESYGQHTFTLEVSSTSARVNPAKKPRISRPVVSKTTGYVYRYMYHSTMLLHMLVHVCDSKVGYCLGHLKQTNEQVLEC